MTCSPRHREPLLRGDLPFIFFNRTRCRLLRPLHKCGLAPLLEPGLAITKVPISIEPSLSPLVFIVYWKPDGKTKYAVLRERFSEWDSYTTDQDFYTIPTKQLTLIQYRCNCPLGD